MATSELKREQARSARCRDEGLVVNEIRSPSVPMKVSEILRRPAAAPMRSGSSAGDVRAGVAAAGQAAPVRPAPRGAGRGRKPSTSPSASTAVSLGRALRVAPAHPHRSRDHGTGREIGPDPVAVHTSQPVGDLATYLASAPAQDARDQLAGVGVDLDQPLMLIVPKAPTSEERTRSLVTACSRAAEAWAAKGGAVAGPAKPMRPSSSRCRPRGHQHQPRRTVRRPHGVMQSIALVWSVPVRHLTRVPAPWLRCRQPLRLPRRPLEHQPSCSNLAM